MNERFEEQQVSGHTIRIDRTLCIGTGNCVAIAPEAFVLGADQIVTFVDAPEDIDPDRLWRRARCAPSMHSSPLGRTARNAFPDLLFQKQ